MKPSKEILSIIQNKLEADHRFNNMVRNRINNLARVGRSVLAKAGMTPNKFSKATIEKYFPVETFWFFEWATYGQGQTIITFADENFIHCTRQGNAGKVDFRIDTDILALSDRDFAKLIRTGIKNFRENERDQEQYARIKHITDMKHAIAVMQEDILKAENLAKEYSVNQERVAQEAMERTRASHARRMARRKRDEAKESLVETSWQ